MKKSFLRGVACAALALSVTVPAIAADLTPQTITRVEVGQVANGYRASKIIGASVVNSAKEDIGKVDDLLVGRQDKVLYAVISVGGFLGVGSKLVVVPYANLQLTADSMMLPGGTKDALKALPEFKYASK